MKRWGITKEEVIKDVLSVYNKNKELFTREFYLENGKFSRAPIKRIFGTWNKMLKELNIPLNCSKMEATKEEVLEDAKRIYDEFGYLDSILHRKEGKYSQTVTDRLFGSFSKMMIELGLHSKREPKSLTDDELLEVLKNLYLENGFINSSLIDKECHISFPTFFKRIGNMCEIYNKLGIVPDSSSKPANDILNIIAEYLNEDPVKEWTCPQLKNPKTNCNLYIDGYFPNYKLAIEYMEFNTMNLPLIFIVI